MAVRKLKNYVNGEWVDPLGANYLDVENPSTGEIISRVPLTSGEETAAAIEAAHKAYLSWKDVPVARRVSYLFKLRDLAGVRTKRRSAVSWWKRWESLFLTPALR